MPLISGARKLLDASKDAPARSAVMSVQRQVAVADGLPRPRLVLVGLGLAAGHPLHPGTGPAEVATVVAEVDRRVGRCRHDGAGCGGGEVLARQVGAGVLQ